MNDIAKLGLKLFVLAAVAGLALGATNAITKGPIAAQAELEKDAARREVLPAAVTFEAADAGEIKEAFFGLDAAGEVVGCTGMASVQGFGGPIEVTVGMTADGTITGVQVGGSGFSETAGLGAKTREPAFYGQFAGNGAPVALTKDGGAIDAVTSATISSGAVIGGVNAVCERLSALLAEGR